MDKEKSGRWKINLAVLLSIVSTGFSLMLFLTLVFTWQAAYVLVHSTHSAIQQFHRVNDQTQVRLSRLEKELNMLHDNIKQLRKK